MTSIIQKRIFRRAIVKTAVQNNKILSILQLQSQSNGHSKEEEEGDAATQESDVKNLKTELQLVNDKFVSFFVHIFAFQFFSDYYNLQRNCNRIMTSLFLFAYTFLHSNYCRLLKLTAEVQTLKQSKQSGH